MSKKIYIHLIYRYSLMPLVCSDHQWMPHPKAHTPPSLSVCLAWLTHSLTHSLTDKYFHNGQPTNSELRDPLSLTENYSPVSEHLRRESRWLMDTLTICWQPINKQSSQKEDPLTDSWLTDSPTIYWQKTHQWMTNHLRMETRWLTHRHFTDKRLTNKWQVISEWRPARWLTDNLLTKHLPMNDQ